MLGGAIAVQGVIRRSQNSIGPSPTTFSCSAVIATNQSTRTVPSEGFLVERLQALKQSHEDRIRFLSGIGGDRRATVIRVVGPVRGVPPELTYDTVMEATTGAGFFPSDLPTSHWNEVDLDLRQHLANREAVPAAIAGAVELISALAARVADGVRRDQISRLAVFAFARIPLLVHLGAMLDDKVETLVFQRHRVDGVNAWRWPPKPRPAPTFVANLLERGAPHDVALILNLSGTIHIDELPAEVTAGATIYRLEPAAPVEAGPTLIDSPAALAAFQSTLRSFFAGVERDHGRIPTVSVFPAVPVSAAVTVGRVLMPDVSPALDVFDRGESGQFFRALTVRR